MTEPTEAELAGTNGRISVSVWRGSEPRLIVVLAHGYGEHAGRYDHVARRLAEAGAVVYGPDHIGHGRSDGERVLVQDVGDLVSDLHAVIRQACDELPGLPVALEQRIYPGARHEIFNEINRDEVLDDVIGFVQRALSEAPA
jgi:alpha-beta hydrolase superfamily lysophospholipase